MTHNTTAVLFGQPWRTAHCKHHLLLQSTSRVCDFQSHGQSAAKNCSRRKLARLKGKRCVDSCESPWRDVLNHLDLNITHWFRSVTTFTHSLCYLRSWPLCFMLCEIRSTSDTHPRSWEAKNMTDWTCEARKVRKGKLITSHVQAVMFFASQLRECVSLVLLELPSR